MAYRSVQLRSRSGTGARAVLVVMALAASGCIRDGRYVVRGSAVGLEDEREVPLASASVTLAPRDGRSGSSRTVLTDQAGNFEVAYEFGGLLLPGVGSDGDPTLDISAEGYRLCRIEVRGDRSATRGVHGKCTTDKPPCFEINALLKPPEAPGGSACEY